MYSSWPCGALSGLHLALNPKLAVERPTAISPPPVTLPSHVVTSVTVSVSLAVLLVGTISVTGLKVIVAVLVSVGRL